MELFRWADVDGILNICIFIRAHRCKKETHIVVILLYTNRNTLYQMPCVLPPFRGRGMRSELNNDQFLCLLTLIVIPYRTSKSLIPLLLQLLIPHNQRSNRQHQPRPVEVPAGDVEGMARCDARREEVESAVCEDERRGRSAIALQCFSPLISAPM